jgi:hypothetical protein
MVVHAMKKRAQGCANRNLEEGTSEKQALPCSYQQYQQQENAAEYRGTRAASHAEGTTDAQTEQRTH